MSNTVIAEGKTTAEAIENGLKQLKVSKNDVDVTVLKDENKKSFFNILAPRTVRVELKLKEKHNENKNIKNCYFRCCCLILYVILHYVSEIHNKPEWSAEVW